jgi:SAM-dependent methyltransferase
VAGPSRGRPGRPGLDIPGGGAIASDRHVRRSRGSVTMTGGDRGYVFGDDRAAEERRLIAQAAIFGPSTERALRTAGVGPGMRVLDLGSGAGDVAMIAARLVGPEGAVVGVERDPEAVARASRRLKAAGMAHVSILAGDAQALDVVEGPFDAVVGRLVLMYLPDPAAAIRRATELLRPGGLVCVQEADFEYVYAFPMSPLWEQVRGWFLEVLTRAGLPTRLGLELYGLFGAAGLPGPELRLEAVVNGGPEAVAWGWANAVRGVLPIMEKLGVASAAEVDVDTLADRLLADVLEHAGVVVGPPLVAAWARRPE